MTTSSASPATSPSTRPISDIPGDLQIAAQEDLSYLQALRRELHQNPEIGLHLPRTQAILVRELTHLGLKVHLGTDLSSVVAVIQGGVAGPTVLLRSDMDALPIREATGLDIAVPSNEMHACGHDLHMAGLIGAARLLMKRQKDLVGQVILAFQPGEEGHGGGQLLVDEGVLDIAGQRPIASYAFHVWPSGTPGTFATKTGTIMAAMTELHVTVQGVGGHASSPQLICDPVPASAEIVLALQSYVTRRIDVADPVVISVTQLYADSAAVNVLPDQVSIAASVRTLSPESLDQLTAQLPDFISQIAGAHGCSAKVELRRLYPVTQNSGPETEDVIDRLQQMFGTARVQRLANSKMASEDFAYILNESPGTFVLMGVRPADVSPDQEESLHSARVKFDDSLLADHAAALAWLALTATEPSR